MKYVNPITALRPNIECLVTDSRFLPKRQHLTDAGADLVAAVEESVTIPPGSRKLIDTGVAVKVPVGFVGYVYSRSGHAKYGISLANRVGVVDSDYRGTIKVFLENNSNEAFEVKPLDRIAQLVISPVMLCDFVDTWNDTERGTGGFGSTGTN